MRFPAGVLVGAVAAVLAVAVPAGSGQQPSRRGVTLYASSECGIVWSMRPSQLSKLDSTLGDQPPTASTLQKRIFLHVATRRGCSLRWSVFRS